MRHENYKILIGKNIARTAAVTVATLGDGEIAAFKPDMTALAAGETIADAPYIYLAQGTAAGVAPKFSAKIQGAEVHKWMGAVYAAATQQVTHVGNVGAGTLDINLVNATEYTLSIIFRFDKVQGSERQLVRRFNYTSTAADTVANISAQFVTLINADPIAKDYVVAASTNNGADYGLSLTSLAQTYKVIDGYEQVYFKVTVEGGFVDGGTTAVTYSTDPAFGTGTYGHVSDLERKNLGEEGITNLMKFPIPSYPVYATSGVNYDMYTILHDDKHASANLNKDMASPEMTIVALNNAGTGMQTALQNELNPWFASCPGAFATVTL